MCIKKLTEQVMLNTYTEFNCTTVSKLSCYISKNTQRSSISIKMQYKKNIKRFSLNFLIVLPWRPADFVLLNLTRLNGCQFMANRNQGSLLHIFLNSMKRYSNLMEGCLYMRNKFYYIRGLRLDLNAIPAVAFDTDMKSWFEIIHEGDVLFDVFVHSHMQLRRNG